MAAIALLMWTGCNLCLFKSTMARLPLYCCHHPETVTRTYHVIWLKHGNNTFSRLVYSCGFAEKRTKSTIPVLWSHPQFSGTIGRIRLQKYNTYRAFPTLWILGFSSQYSNQRLTVWVRYYWVQAFISRLNVTIDVQSSALYEIWPCRTQWGS